MKLAMFSRGEGRRPGALLTDLAAMVDLGEGLGAAGSDPPTTTAELFEGGSEALDRARGVVDRVRADPDAAVSAGLLVAMEECKLHEPIGGRPLVLCAGMNYRSHLAEMGERGLVPPRPMGFIKNTNAVIGSGDAITLPPSHPAMVDWEGEFCVVIGTPCQQVKADDAMAVIGGYTILNDVSARDFTADIRAAKSPNEINFAWNGNVMAKQFPTFCPLGPVVVTSDEIPDPEAALRLTTTVNAELMQDAKTDDFIFGIREIIEEFTKYHRLQPGDVISTGTCGGVGMGRTPPVFLRAGDEVSVTVEGIGSLTNTVAGP